MNNILPFPAPSRPASRMHPSSLWWRYHCCRDWLRIQVCRLVNWVNIPGTIANFEVDDEVSGLRIEARTGIFFTRLSINGRDFYFRRFSGKFDGTGSGCT